MTDSIPRLRTEGAIAERFELTTKALQAWRLRGEGPPFVKLGRAVRYNEADVLVWLESRTVKSTSAATVVEGAA